MYSSVRDASHDKVNLLQTSFTISIKLIRKIKKLGEMTPSRMLTLNTKGGYLTPQKVLDGSYSYPELCPHTDVKP